MPQTMKIPDAKAAVDKEWEKLEQLPAWQMTNVKSKIEVIKKAQKEQRTVHSATPMDIYHLNNAELEPKCQKYKGRVMLRGDTERRFWHFCSINRAGFVNITNDGRKSNGCHRKATRMCRTSSRRNVMLHPSKNGGRFNTIETSQVRMSRFLDTSTTTYVAKIMVQH